MHFLDDVARIVAQLRGDEDLPSPQDDSPTERAKFSYALNARGASTDFSPRQARHAALVAVMHGSEAPKKIAKLIRDAYEDGEELYKKLMAEVRETLKPTVEERGFTSEPNAVTVNLASWLWSLMASTPKSHTASSSSPMG